MQNSINYDRIKGAAAYHPSPDIKFTYGTAGFRMKYDLYYNLLTIID
jgi:hypothetical protein